MANGKYKEKREAKAAGYKESLLKANPSKKAALDLMSTGQLIRKGKQASRVATKSIGLENQKNKQVLQNAKNELNKQDVNNVTSIIGDARTDLQNQQKSKMVTQGYGDKSGKAEQTAKNINTALEQTKPLIDVDVEKGSSGSSSVNQNVNVVTGVQTESNAVSKPNMKARPDMERAAIMMKKIKNPAKSYK